MVRFGDGGELVLGGEHGGQSGELGARCAKLDAVLISGLTASFLAGVQDNDAIPQDLSLQAQVDLGGGIPFISNDDLSDALTEAGITGDTAEAIMKENEESRIAGLRASLFVLALLALLALFFTSGIPRRQPGAADVTPTS